MYKRQVPGGLPGERDGVQLAPGHGEILQARGAAHARGEAVGPQGAQGALLLVGGVVRVGGGDDEVPAGGGRAGEQPLAVEEGAPAADGGGELVARRRVGPGGDHDAPLDERHQRAEAVVAVHELTGAVDRVDDPHRYVVLERPVHRRVGVHRLLADDHRAGQQGAEVLGEPQFGEAVGVRHQVVGAALLVDLVRGEVAEAGQDLGRGGLADRFLHVGRAAGEKLVDGFRLFDHAPHESTPH